MFGQWLAHFFQDPQPKAAPKPRMDNGDVYDPPKMDEGTIKTRVILGHVADDSRVDAADQHWNYILAVQNAVSRLNKLLEERPKDIHVKLEAESYAMLSSMQPDPSTHRVTGIIGRRF